jgi:hypothetical protein
VNKADKNLSYSKDGWQMFSNPFGSISKIVFVAVLAALASSCSMKSNESNVTISLPDWQKMKAADEARRSKVSTLAVTYSELSMVIVNISGGGLAQPVFFAWERHDDDNAVPPTTISLSVPKGSGRLVQVLGVYENEGAMEFYYGDSPANMTADVVPVPITISNVATANSQKEGKIAGRYVEAGNIGPTGVFQYRFQPPGGTKPSMVIHHGEIFNGWMSLFSLSSPLIQYTKVDGTPIFTGFYNSNPALHDVSTATLAKRTMSILVPSGYAKHGDTNSPDWVFRPEKRIVVGYFGPGAGNRGVCVPNASPFPLKDFYAGPSTSYGQVTFNYNTSSLGTLSTVVERVSSTLVGDGGGTKGGMGVSSGAFPSACASGASSQLGIGTAYEWDDYIVLSTRGLGDEDPIAFKGPFASLGFGQDGTKWMTLAHDGSSSVAVDWKYIPGVGITNAGVFWRLTANPWNDNGLRADDGFRCNDLSAMGFNKVDVSGGAQSAVLGGISEAQLPQLQVVVCPFNQSAGKYFQSAIRGVGRIPQGVLGFKIVGNSAKTDYWHPKMLAPNQWFLMSSFLTGDPGASTRFAPSIDGKMLPVGAVLSVEASTNSDDNGWTYVSTSPVFVDGENRPYVSALDVANQLNSADSRRRRIRRSNSGSPWRRHSLTRGGCRRINSRFRCARSIRRVALPREFSW